SGGYTEEEDDRWYGVRGFFRWLESKTYKMHVRVLLSRYRAYVTCPGCKGGRYQPEALNYEIVAAVYDRRDGARTAPLQLTLPEFQALSISDGRDLLMAIDIPSNDSTARMLRDEICARLDYLCEVGVGYLTLDRSTRTLSGGEVQRVNLTTCLGASLVNTLFVMDEPSVGLHPRDVGQLVRVMHNLRDKGNTLLVVEHDEAIIRAADNLIDIGPDLPLGVFTCVTGVSGSGKSTLIHDVLYRNLLRAKGGPSDQEPGACRSVTGPHRIGEVVMVDQAPLARTPRSTPILY